MPGPVTFNNADRLIRMAMVDAGLLQDGDDPTSEQFANYMNRLNDVINFWQTQGLKLWLQYDLPVPLVAEKASYALGPGGDVNMTKPLRVLDSSYYLDSSGNSRPLIILSRDDWSRLPKNPQNGAISSYFPDKQQLQLVVNFWLTPDATAATGIVHLIIQQQVQNLVSLTDAMNFPLEWFIALRWGLADDIATGQPKEIMDRCAQRATFYRTALEDFDVEDAPTSFAPDTRDAGRFGAR